MKEFVALIFVYSEGKFSPEVIDAFKEMAFQSLTDNNFLKKFTLFFNSLGNQKDIIIKIRGYSTKEESINNALKTEDVESLLIYDSVLDSYFINGNGVIFKDFV